MKLSEFYEKQEELKYRIAELVDEKENIKLWHSIDGKQPINEELSYSGKWSLGQDGSFSYSLSLWHNTKGLLCESLSGNFFKRLNLIEISKDELEIFKDLEKQMQDFLEDKIDWPFTSRRNND